MSASGGLTPRDEFIVKAVEGCRPCGGGALPVLLEVTRFNFVLTEHIGSGAWQVFRQVVIMSKGQWRKFGDMVGFYSQPEDVGHALGLFRAIDFPVHTLEEHVEMLSARYRDELEDFGALRFVQLPLGEAWQVYDPGARDFVFLPTFPTSEGNGANLREGSIIRARTGGSSAYYRFSGLTLEGRQVIYRVDKGAAYELVVPFLRPIPAYWVRHADLHVGVVPAWQLNFLPGEVFQALVRFNPLKRSLPEMFIFDEGDFEVAKKLLAYARVQLKQAVAVVQLPFQKDAIHGSPVMPLSDVPSSKLEAFTAAIGSSTGSSTARDSQFVRITHADTVVPVCFVYGDHGSGLDGKLYVALPNVVDPEKAVFFLQSLCGQLGVKLQDDEARKALAVCWPPDEPGDAAFCLRTFIENSDDEAFARAFMAYPRHKDLIASWSSDAASQPNLGEEMVERARRVQQRLLSYQ